MGHGMARLATLIGLVCLLVTTASRAQETIYTNVTSERLEAILKELNITYKKAPGKKDGVYSYDFERKGFKVRMYNYSGEDLWLESYFAEKATLEAVNKWNTRAKFSRAVLVKDASTASISLEAQVDCTLGITAGMIRHFVQRFDDELETFSKYLTK